MKTQGKVIVVTGGGNGLGRQLVLQLIARGASVAAVDINEEGLHETRQLAGQLASRVSLYVCDISDRDRVKVLADNVILQFGHVDGVINNAGIIHRFEHITRLGFDTIDKVMQVNLFGLINVTKMFLPCLVTRPDAHIVNVSSMGGMFAFPGQTIYGASKAAVKLFTEGLLVELRQTKVGVTVVFPGAIATDITKNCGAHTDRIDKLNQIMSGTAADVAAARIINAMEKGRFRVQIGLDAHILSFLYRVAPKGTLLLINKVMKMALG